MPAQEILREALRVATNAPNASQARREAACRERGSQTCTRPGPDPSPSPARGCPLAQWDFRFLYEISGHKDHQFWKDHPQDSATLGPDIGVRRPRQAAKISLSLSHG